jgi:hypothetical protein
LREAISIEKQHFTSHVVHVDNLDASLHLGYAKHAIVHAKAASLRARLVFINLSSLQKRTESGLGGRKSLSTWSIYIHLTAEQMERSKKAD